MPTVPAASQLTKLFRAHKGALLEKWLEELRESVGSTSSGIMEGEFRTQCRDLIQALGDLPGGEDFNDIDKSSFGPIRGLLDAISRSSALQGFSSKGAVS